MRAPSPVEYVGAHCRAWQGVLSLLVGASVAVPVAWGWPYLVEWAGHVSAFPVLATLANTAIQGAFAVSIGFAACAAFWSSRRSTAASGHARERSLRWDGQDWVLPGRAGSRLDQRGDVALVLDLGPWMLVHFVPRADESTPSGARGTWLPLTLSSDGARWASLRDALWNWRASVVHRP
jgi:hypothetical protein